MMHPPTRHFRHKRATHPDLYGWQDGKGNKNDHSKITAKGSE